MTDRLLLTLCFKYHTRPNIGQPTMREHSDHKGIRPIGEGGDVPDEADYDSSNRSVTPADRVPANMLGIITSCRSCGTSIPTDRTKCEFCLEHGIAPDDPEGADTGSKLLGIAYSLVPARSETTALALGAAACSLLEADPASPVDDHQLVADVDDLASTVVDNWGDLPSVIRTDSDAGKWLLEAALTAELSSQDLAEAHADATLLVNEAGKRIQSPRKVAKHRATADHPMWLVPAIALRQPSADDENEVEGGHPAARRRKLHCWDCQQETPHTHRRQTHSEGDELHAPLWECDVCGTPQHGPSL